MPIDYQRALALDIPAVEHSYTQRDTMLYALGLGLGEDPMDRRQLRYVYERELQVFPTMPVVMAAVSIKDLAVGFDYTKMVHGEQTLAIHAPLPAEATVVGRSRITEVVDRGPGKGAIVYLERSITEKAGGRLLATAMSSLFCRADGGFGGPVTQVPAPHALPERAPDLSRDFKALPQLALIYRLSGDYNPLHADPEVARAAGFERPILHGLATYGIVARAVVEALLEGDGSRLRSFAGRFSSPVFPGDTLRVEMWREGDAMGVRARVVERDVVVFNNGRVTAIAPT